MTDTSPDKRLDSDRMQAILVLVATVGFVTAPLWSRGFGGFESDAFPVPLDNPPTQPAGFAFSIWGIIYAWLVVSAVYGLFFRVDNAQWRAGRWWLIASLAVGTPWISVAAVSPVWATVLIVVMLVTALRSLVLTPQDDRWFLRLPVGLYAGWLTAATGVSFSLFAIGYGATIITAVAALLVFLLGGMALQLRLPGAGTYGLAMAWGAFGVATKNFASASIPIGVLAALTTALLLAAANRSEKRRS